MIITYYQRPIDVDMHQCMMMEGVEITIGAGTGGTHYTHRIPGGADRATVMFGERIQAMRDEERLMGDKDNSDSEQEDILSASAQEDLFDVDEDHQSLNGG